MIKRLLWSLVVCLGACGGIPDYSPVCFCGQPDAATAGDMAPVVPADMAGPDDLARPGSDLGHLPPLLEVADAANAPAADLAQPAPDLAPVADLAEAVGGVGQPCRDGSSCDSGVCMRSSKSYPPGSGLPAYLCVPAVACGAYDYPACEYNGDEWCERDKYAATDGNTTGWLVGSPCKP